MLITDQFKLHCIFSPWPWPADTVGLSWKTRNTFFLTLEKPFFGVSDIYFQRNYIINHCHCKHIVYFLQAFLNLVVMKRKGQIDNLTKKCFTLNKWVSWYTVRLYSTFRTFHLQVSTQELVGWPLTVLHIMRTMIIKEECTIKRGLVISCVRLLSAGAAKNFTFPSDLMKKCQVSSKILGYWTSNAVPWNRYSFGLWGYNYLNWNVELKGKARSFRNVILKYGSATVR